MTSTASAYSYATPGTAGGALTPYDMQPTYSIEALCGIADKSENPDMWGVRVGFSLYSDAVENFRHQFGIYVAPMWGSESYSFAFMDGTLDRDVDAMLIPITFGYDLNIALSDEVFLDLGVKAGYAYADVDVTERYDIYSGSAGETGGGFTFSVGAAIKVMLSDAVQIKLGYEFARSYIDAGDFGDMAFGQHIISLGVGCTF